MVNTFRMLSYALFTLCGGVLLFGEEVTIGSPISSQVNEDVLSVRESKRFDDSLMLNDSNNDVLKLGIPHEQHIHDVSGFVNAVYI